jgi:hypothetical protein
MRVCDKLSLVLTLGFFMCVCLHQRDGVLVDGNPQGVIGRDTVERDELVGQQRDICSRPLQAVPREAWRGRWGACYFLS